MYIKEASVITIPLRPAHPLSPSLHTQAVRLWESSSASVLKTVTRLLLTLGSRTCIRSREARSISSRDLLTLLGGLLALLSDLLALLCNWLASLSLLSSLNARGRSSNTLGLARRYALLGDLLTSLLALLRCLNTSERSCNALRIWALLSAGLQLRAYLSLSWCLRLRWSLDLSGSLVLSRLSRSLALSGRRLDLCGSLTLSGSLSLDGTYIPLMLCWKRL
jgi:hypothetical protein